MANFTHNIDVDVITPSSRIPSAILAKQELLRDRIRNTLSIFLYSIALSAFCGVGAAVMWAFEEVLADKPIAVDVIFDTTWSDIPAETIAAMTTTVFVETSRLAMSELERVRIRALNTTFLVVTVEPASILGDRKWDAYGSFFYVYDVVTTIGFGQRYPITTGGKIATSIMTLAGCPLLAVLCNQIAGSYKEIMQDVAQRVFQVRDITLAGEQHHVTHFLAPSKPVTSLRRRFAVALFFELFNLLVFIFIPAAFFVGQERWNYLDSVYYAGDALSSIGFGSWVAGEDPESVHAPLGLYRAGHLIWLTVGIGWWIGYMERSVHRLKKLTNWILNPIVESLALWWIDRTKKAKQAIRNRDQSESDNPMVPK